MAISKMILSVVCALSFVSAPALAQTSAKTTDYIVSDYGSFIGDSTNFNGILRVIKLADGTITAEVSAARSVSMDFVSYEPKPFLVTAVLTLEEMPKGAFKITKVTIMNQSYGKDLIFKVGGIINPNGTNDFGGLELQYRDSENSFPRMGTSFTRTEQ